MLRIYDPEINLHARDSGFYAWQEIRVSVKISSLSSCNSSFTNLGWNKLHARWSRNVFRSCELSHSHDPTWIFYCGDSISEIEAICDLVEIGFQLASRKLKVISKIHKISDILPQIVQFAVVIIHGGQLIFWNPCNIDLYFLMYSALAYAVCLTILYLQSRL